MNPRINRILCLTAVTTVLAGCGHDASTDFKSAGHREGTLDDIWVMVTKDPSSQIDGTLIPLEIWIRGEFAIRYHGEIRMGNHDIVRELYCAPDPGQLNRSHTYLRRSAAVEPEGELPFQGYRDEYRRNDTRAGRILYDSWHSKGAVVEWLIL